MKHTTVTVPAVLSFAVVYAADAGLVRTQVARFADASGLLDRYAGAGLSQIGFIEPITSYEGGSTETFDTTPLWTPASERTYGILTASSVALWESIVAQQLSGTFTFEMTQTVQELGCNGVQILVGGGLGGLGAITSGRTFTVNVDGVGAARPGRSRGGRSPSPPMTFAARSNFG